MISALHRRHRTIEFTKFLAKIDTTVPAHLHVHLIADNYGAHKTPAIKKWLTEHPRFWRSALLGRNIGPHPGGSARGVLALGRWRSGDE